MKKSKWAKLIFFVLGITTSLSLVACKFGSDSNTSSSTDSSQQQEENSSSSVEPVQLLAPVIDLDYDNGVFWSAQSNVAGYIVNVNGTDMEMQTGEYFEPLTVAGTYTVKVKAVSSSDAYLDSDWSNEVTFTVEQTYAIEKFQSVAYAIVGADRVAEGANYTFSVSVNSLYEGDYTVWVNGQQVTATDGIYTVENVQEDLSIEVKGLTVKMIDVTVASNNHVTFTGDVEVPLTSDYSFAAIPEDGYGMAVYVNGAQVLPTDAGNYVVKNVTEALEITFWVYENTVAVTYASVEGVTFKGASKASVFEDYNFELETVSDGYVVYCNNSFVRPNADGTYTIKNVQPETPLAFNFVQYGAGTLFIPSTYSDECLVTDDVYQAHAETDCVGITGMKLISPNEQTEFIYGSTVNLNEGENIIAKFMTTNKIKPVWSGDFEVNYVEYALTDTVTGDKLVVRVSSTWFTDGEGSHLPNAYLAFWFNGEFIGIQPDGYWSNFSNVTTGESTAYKYIPEIRLNTTTGSISYSNKADILTESALIGFGVENELSVSITLNLKEVGYGIVLDTFCNEKLSTWETVNFTEENGVTYEGDTRVKRGEDYTFKAMVEDTFILHVYCNGTELRANRDGTYTVKNVTETLSITFKATATIAQVTKDASSVYTIVGEDKVGMGETYTFSVTVNEGMSSGEYVVLVNGEEVAANNGVYSVVNVQEDLHITVYEKDKKFYVSMGDGAIQNNVYQAHAQVGCSGLTGMKLIATEEKTTFTYGEKVKLNEGENVIAKFMTTNTIMPVGQSNFEVNYVTYTLKDTVTGDTLVISVRSTYFVDGETSTLPKAWMAFWFNGTFLGLVDDSNSSNFSNVTMNDTNGAWTCIPEIKLNTTTGCISYCTKADVLTNAAFIGFGIENELSVSVELHVKEMGHGVVINTLCNQSLEVELPDNNVSVNYTDLEGVTYNGAETAKKGESYTFTATVGEGYALAVYCNGVQLVANADGTYTVQNVVETLNITFTRKAITANVTKEGCEGYTIVGADTATLGENYTFTVTASGDASQNGCAVFVNGVEVVAVNGVYSVVNVQEDLYIKVYDATKKFYVSSGNGSVEKDVYQAHAEAGLDGVMGTKLTATGTAATFNYLSNVTLNEGENVIAKFMTTNAIMPSGQGNYEVNYVTFHLKDTVTSDTLSISVRSYYFVDEVTMPSAYVALFFNGSFIGIINDDYYSNFSNETRGSDWAFLLNPEIKLDTTTGTLSYCNKTMWVLDSLAGFGVTNALSVSVELNLKEAGNGVVIETLCNKQLSNEVKIVKSESEAYTITGADTASKGEPYTFSVSVNEELYENNYTVLVNGEAVTATDGVYSVDNVQRNLYITVEGLVKKTSFSVTSGNGTVEKNASQAHAETGVDGVIGMKLTATDTAATFNFLSNVKLIAGENVIAKFMTTNDIMPTGEGKYEVNYVTFHLADTVTGNTLSVSIRSYDFVDGVKTPSAYVALFFNGSFIGIINDDYYSNFSNETRGSDWAFLMIPEIRLNTTTGALSYCNKTMWTFDYLMGFGVTNELSVSVELNLKEAGNGVVIETLCNEKLSTISKVTKAQSDAYTIIGADSVNNGEAYTFSVTVNEALYEGQYIVLVNGEEVTAVDGVYSIADVQNDLSIMVKGLVKKTSFSVTSGNGTVEKNESQEHAEAGVDGVTGTKLTTTDTTAAFTYDSTMKLSAGENVLAKFMTTNDVMPSGQGKYEVDYVTFHFTDTVTGDKLTVSIRSYPFVEGNYTADAAPHAYAVLFLNGNFIGIVSDDYYSNFSNVTRESDWAFLMIPEIKLNTTTGAVSYCNKTMWTFDSLIGFGVTNEISVNVEINLHVAGHGIVIETLCNEKLSAEIA